MKRIIILLILCLLALGMIYSCTLQHEVEPTLMPTPQPCYVIEYTKGVTILREVR